MRQRHQPSFSANSRDSSPPIDETPNSESGHATNQVIRESYSQVNRLANTANNMPMWPTQLNNSQESTPHNTLPNSRQERRARQKKETKAGIMISCLNINGFGCSGSRESIQNSKWSHVNQLLRTSRTGILIVSEAHLTERRRDELENLFARRMKIHFTADPENPTGKGGVAIVVNKQLTLWHYIKTKVVIPGRALLMKTRWYGEKEITILGIYGPNVKRGDAKDSAKFFETLYNFFDANRNWWPDYMGGDMNFVEDAIDRLPMHNDHSDVLTAFDNLKQLLGLRDGWRSTFPDKKSFSFSCTKSVQSPDTNEIVRNTYQSRIDRIYVTDKLFEQARQWQIHPVGITGVDHEMVSVQIAHEEAPLIGKGRWACPDFVLKDRQLSIKVKELGLSAQQEIDAIRRAGRTQDVNPQRTYHKFITEAMNLAKERERIIKAQTQLKESTLSKAIDATSKNQSLSDMERSNKLGKLKSELKNLKQDEHENSRRFIAAKDHLEGETVSKYYFQVNKESKPRDVIHALEIPNTRRSQTRENLNESTDNQSGPAPP